MLDFFARKKYAPTRVSLTLVLVFTLLLNTLPIAALNKPALAETLNDTDSNNTVKTTQPVELIDLRTENAKIYQNEDGTRSAKVYNAPIHYKDQNGKYQDIDNSVGPDTDPVEQGSFRYQNKANSFKAFFAENTQANNLYKVKKDNYWMSMNPVNANKVSATTSGDTVTYKGVYDQVDLQYIINSSGVKENLVINNHTDQNTFSFKILSNNLQPKLEANNSLGLYDSQTGQAVFAIPTPFAEDANGVFSGDVSYSLQQVGQDFILTVNVSKEYLDSSDRQFPVTVDPSTDTLSGTTYDSFVMSAYPSYNYWSTAEERAGWTSSTGICRSYMKFTLPSMAGYIVSSASLNLYEFSGNTSSANIEAHEIISNWSDTSITWNQRPNYNDINLGTNLANHAGWYSWDVSNLVTAWYSGRTNNGIMIKEDSENDYYRTFYSYEATGSKPYISINYSSASLPSANVVSNGVNSQKGDINLSWPSVAGASRYSTLIYDGYQYDEFPVGNTTSWSTNGIGIFPTSNELSSGVWQFHNPNGGGADLSDDPRALYTNAYNAHLGQVGTFTDYRNNLFYAIRTKAYRDVSIETKDSTTNTDYTTSYTEATDISGAVCPIIPDSTSPPAVTNVTLSENNGTYGTSNASSVTASWARAIDPTTGSNSGTSYYKVSLTNLNTSSTTSVNVSDTGAGSYSYTFSNQPNDTRYQVSVTTYDKSGNYSTPVQAAFSRNSGAYKQNGAYVSNNVPRFEAGKFGQALTLEELTTNLINNGSMEAVNSSSTVFASNMQRQQQWVANNGSFTWSSSGATSNSNNSSVRTGYYSWTPLANANVDVHGCFTTSGVVPKGMQVVLQKNPSNYYQAVWQGDNNFVIYKSVNGSYTPLVGNSMAVSQAANTPYILEMWIDVNGNITAQIQNGSGSALSTISVRDTSVTGPYDFVVGADQGVLITKAYVVAPTPDNYSDQYGAYNGGNISTDFTAGKFGSRAVRMDKSDWNSGASDNYLHFNPYNGNNYAVSANTNYTLSVGYKLNMTSTTAQAPRSVGLVVFFMDSNGNSTGSAATNWGWPDTGSGWSTGSISFVTPANTARIGVELRMSCNGTVWWDGLQLEQKAYPTSFIDNSRSEDQLNIPSSVLNPLKGTIQFWVNVNSNVQTASKDWSMAFALSDNGESNQIRFGKSSLGSNQWHAKFTNGAGTSWLPQFSISSGWHAIALSWNKSTTTAKVYVDGNVVASNISAPIPDSFANTYGGVAYIGRWIGGGFDLDSQIDDLRISSVDRSDSEISSDAAGGNPLPQDVNTTYKLNFDGSLSTTTDNSLPTGNITSPANNACVNGTVNIIGNANDDSFSSYKLEYGAGTSPTSWTQITSSTSPITNSTLASWNVSSLTDGTYTVRLTITDKAGNVTTNSIQIVKDGTLPTGSITAPSNNGYVNGTVNIVGTASDTNFNDYKVEYGSGSVPATWNLVKYATTSVTNSNLASWDTSLLGDGQYTIRLTVTDKVGNVKTTSILVTKDATYPIATITSPTGNQYLKGSVNVVGTATDSNFSNYKLEYASQLTPSNWNTIISSTNQVSGATLGTWNTGSMGDGVYNLRLTVTDLAGLVSTSAVNGVIVDNTLPTASFSTPAANAYVKGTVTVTGTASDTNFSSAKVEYGAGASPTSWTQIASLSSGVTNGTLTSWNTTALAAGTYTLRLTVNDKSGNAIVVTRIVSVDNIAPTVSFTSPSNNQTVSGVVTVSASGTDNLAYDKTNLSIKKYGTNDTQNLGTVTGATADWNWDTAKLSDGEYVLTLTGYDKAANANTAQINVKVTNIATGMGLDHWGTVDNRFGKINIANGNFVVNETDINLPGRGLGTDFSRVYNSQMPTNGVLGWGWRINLPEISQYSDGSIVIIEGDGTQHTYTLNGEGSYARPAGDYDILTKNPDNTFTLQFKNGEKYVFDAANHKLTLIDKNANTVVYQYNASAQLTSITDPTSRVTNLSYNGTTGRLASVTDYASRTWTYGYDTSGNLSTVTDPLNHTMSFAYDANHELTSITDARNNTTTFAYTSGKLTGVTDPAPLSYSTTYSYDLTNKQFTETNANGNATRYAYDTNWNVTSITNALNKTTSFTYDADYNELSVTDALGRVTTYTYDSMGNLLSETDPMNHVTNYTYDSSNNMLTKTDALNHTTTFGYDSKGNMVTNDTAVYTYNPDGTVATVKDAKGNVTTNGYDSNGNLISITDALGNVTNYQYDTKGSKTRESTSSSNWSNYTYDVLGRMLTVIVPDDSGSKTTTYTYDANGNRLTVTDASGNVTTWTYDAINRATSTTEPGNKTSSSTYDAVSNVTSQTAVDGTVTNYTYDALNRQTQINYPDGKVVSYSYDDVGNKTGVTDSSGTTTYEYNADNNLVKETSSSGRITTYNYNTIHNLTGKTVNGKSVTLNYGTSGNLDSMVDSNNITTSFGYDPNNNRTATNYASGTKVTYGYDATDKLTNVKNLGPTGNVLSNFDYTYYDNGQVKTVTDSNGITTYEYDGQNRITKITNPQGNTIVYTYDSVGNRTSVVNTVGTTSSTTTYAYDPVTNQLNSISNPDGSTASYTYNANGNTLTKVEKNSSGNTTSTASYEYNTNNQLTKVTKSNGDVIEFTYDGNNKRTSKSLDGVVTKYLYDGDLVSEETDATGNTLAYYVYDDKGTPISVSKGGQTYNYQYNAHGDVVALTDSSGNVVATYAYDVWGNVAAKTGNVESLFGYAGRVGYVYDNETGLYFLQSRYYDPEIGRFTTRDRFKGFENRPTSQNQYTYCDNDPVNGVDPYGYFTQYQFQVAYRILTFLAGIFAVASYLCAISGPWFWGYTGILGYASWIAGFGAYNLSIWMWYKGWMPTRDFLVGSVLSIAGIVTGWMSFPVSRLLKVGWRELSFVMSKTLSWGSAATTDWRRW
jgi:RHS repeat-associated protein